MDLVRQFLWCSVLCVALLCSWTATAQAGVLYVVNDNATMSQIYGFSVNETTGALTALPGFPVNAGTGILQTRSEMMTIDTTNNRLYVLNDGSDNISAFSINPATGALTPLPFSPITLGAGGWNTIVVHPSGSPLVAGDGDTTPVIASFNITATTATAAAGSPFATGTARSFSSLFSPDGNYYYVGGNAGMTFGGFSVDATTGVLTALTASPFNSGGNNPTAYAIDSSGRLFMANSLANQLRAFTTASGVPTAVTGNPFTMGLTTGPDGVLHPNGQFYMVADRTGNRVGVYQIAGSGAATTLAPVTGSPFLSNGTLTQVLAFNQTGSLLFAANGDSRNITTYRFLPLTGELINLGVQPVNTAGTAGRLNGMAYFPTLALPTRPVQFDFDGDGKSDISVFRNGDWYVQRSTGGFFGLQFGAASDRIAPADYDGDGKTDVAVFRPEARGVFYILQSSNNTSRAEIFGQTGDVPTGGDWDGDGKADVAVYRTGTQGFFYYRPSTVGGTSVVGIAWGTTGDVPVAADFDGDGRTDAAVYRSGTWIWRQSTDGALRSVQFGAATDKPVPADYDGDAKADPAVFRNGEWFILGSTAGFRSVTFGTATDVPVAADYDGDGRADVAVFRDGNWYRLNSSNNQFSAFLFGQAGDRPIPAAFLP